MTNTYRALTDNGIAMYADGVFEQDFTAIEEQDELNSGHIEIAPRPYRVLSDNYEAGGQGETVELALLKEQEAALLAGGHLERVDKKPAAKAADKKEK